MKSQKPLVLIILDGWGYRETQAHNAIEQAATPNWDRYWKNYPHCIIQGSGHAVGLPDGQMGNSEVGHLTIGAGRIVDQDLTRIDKEIAHHQFEKNPVFSTLFNDLITTPESALHIIGLLSEGGVHSHEQHILRLIEIAAQKGLKKVYLHAFLDGRDTPPRSALASLERAETLFNKHGHGCVASIIGRYYAMDRDKRWDRVRKAYDLLTLGLGHFEAKNSIEALELAYARGEDDEFVQSTIIRNPDLNIVQDGDSVVFMNFRADRARQLSRAFLLSQFDGFVRKYIPNVKHFVTLTEYAQDIPSEVVYPPFMLKNLFGEYISKHGLKQLRIAETEKYAHVTFFFNGGQEEPVKEEHRILIDSPKVETYDLKPEMSAYELTDALIKAINTQMYDVIICNYANADMVGHSGNFAATQKAIEVLDECLGNVINAVQQHRGEVIITAHHGNAECMFNSTTQQPHTAHTSDPVPCLYISDRNAQMAVAEGTLSDIAPTLLYLLGLPIPAEMTGKSLIKLNK